MKIDIYTKGVLTIIALCLVYLCLGKPALSVTAQAQAEPTRVLLAGYVDWQGKVRAFAVGGGENAALPVTVQSDR